MPSSAATAATAAATDAPLRIVGRRGRVGSGHLDAGRRGRRGFHRRVGRHLVARSRLDDLGKLDHLVGCFGDRAVSLARLEVLVRLVLLVHHGSCS
jgi:hypothetical protein